MIISCKSESDPHRLTRPKHARALDTQEDGAAQFLTLVARPRRRVLLGKRHHRAFAEQESQPAEFIG